MTRLAVRTMVIGALITGVVFVLDCGVREGAADRSVRDYDPASVAANPAAGAHVGSWGGGYGTAGRHSLYGEPYR